MSVKTRIFVSISMAAAILPVVAQACSVCFGGDDDALTHAFNWSVGFLLAAPYVIAGTIAVCLVLAYRRAAVKQAALDERQAMETLIWTQEESAK